MISSSIERLEPGPRMSRAVVHGDTVYISGHVSDKASASVAEQTRDILMKIEQVLAQTGSDKSRILSANVWLADAGMYNEMNGVWDAWIDRQNPPARACVESRLASSAYKVEIALIAARK